MTLYAVLVFVFDTFPVSLCKGKGKTKEKRETKEKGKRAFGTLWPFRAFRCCALSDACDFCPSRLARRYAPPSPSAAAARSQTCTSTAQIAFYSVRSDPRVAHLSLLSSVVSPPHQSHHSRRRAHHACRHVQEKWAAPPSSPSSLKPRPHPYRDPDKNYKKARKRRLRHSLPR